MSSVDCSNVADADLLGLGVRIGAYLQVLSSIVNLKLDSEDSPGSAWLQVFTAVPLLVFAFKFLLQGTIRNAAFIATAYISWAHLLILPSVLLMPSIHCFKLLVALIYAAVAWTCGVLLWYWADGFERMEACGDTDAFFFAQVPAFGWFRYLNLALLGLVAVLYVVLLIPVLGSRRRLARTASARLQRLNSPLRIGVGLLLGLVFCVLGCELTLHWNEVPYVNSLDSTGQMIPLLLGVAAVTRDAYFGWARTRPCPAPFAPLAPQHEQPAAIGGGSGLPTGALADTGEKHV